MSATSCLLRLFAVLAAAGLATQSAPALAAEGDAAGGPASLKVEWVGLELTPVSLSLASSCCYDRPGHVDRFEAGRGASLRLLRHRWEHYYLIPIEAGAYVSSDDDTIFVHVQTEGGLIVPGTDRRVELGMGLGAGILSMKYAVGCDDSCVLGGAGWLASFVARFLIVDRPTFTVGANARLIIPLTKAEGDYWGHFIGTASIALAGLEVAFGHG